LLFLLIERQTNFLFILRHCYVSKNDAFGGELKRVGDEIGNFLFYGVSSVSSVLLHTEITAPPRGEFFCNACKHEGRKTGE
jgi:hypothetical protein